MKKITLFSDGSALGNPGPGGYGVVLRYEDNEKELSGSEAHTTNNKMELLAVVEGLNEWLEAWRKKDFKKVKNPGLCKDYIAAAHGHIVKATWIRGHDGHAQNERCDKLARDAAQEMKDSL